MINVLRKIEKVIVDPIRSNDATKRIIVISVFNDLDMFIARVKYRRLQTPFVGNCRINGWGKCRF